MRIVPYKDLPPAGWDDYVDRHPQASAYHRAAWSCAVANVFRLEVHFLAARGADEHLCGVLPLVRQKSLLFGDRLTSLPYFNYGGALADDAAIRRALMARPGSAGNSAWTRSSSATWSRHPSTGPCAPTR